MVSNVKPLHQIHKDVQGITIQGNNQAVLCLHGFTATPQTFSELAPLIHQHTGYHVHAPLMPGHGGLPTDLNTVTYQDWIDCAKQALQALHTSFESVHLVGLSMGGTLCLMLDQTYKDTIKSINLLAPGLRFASYWKEHVPTLLMQHLPRKYLQQKMLHKPNANPKQVSYQQYSMQNVVELFHLFTYTRSILQPSGTPLQIQTPIDDAVIHAKDSVKIASYYNTNNVQFYPDTPHVMVHAAAKDVIFSRIQRWITTYS